MTFKIIDYLDENRKEKGWIDEDQIRNLIPYPYGNYYFATNVRRISRDISEEEWPKLEGFKAYFIDKNDVRLNNKIGIILQKK